MTDLVTDYFDANGTLRMEYGYDHTNPRSIAEEGFYLFLDTSTQELTLSSRPYFGDPFVLRRTLSLDTCRRIEESDRIRSLLSQVRGYSYRVPSFIGSDSYFVSEFSLTIGDSTIFDVSVYDLITPHPMELYVILDFIRELSRILYDEDIMLVPERVYVGDEPFYLYCQTHGR